MGIYPFREIRGSPWERSFIQHFDVVATLACDCRQVPGSSESSATFPFTRKQPRGSKSVRLRNKCVLYPPSPGFLCQWIGFNHFRHSGVTDRGGSVGASGALRRPIQTKSLKFPVTAFTLVCLNCVMWFGIRSDNVRDMSVHCDSNAFS